MVKHGAERQDLLNLITTLKKQTRAKKAPIWKRVAELLEKPSRSRIEANLIDVQRNAKEGETIVIPGKLLSLGILSKKVTIACFECSPAAAKKATAAGSKIITISKLIETKPDGAGVRIIV